MLEKFLLFVFKEVEGFLVFFEALVLNVYIVQCFHVGVERISTRVPPPVQVRMIRVDKLLLVQPHQLHVRLAVWNQLSLCVFPSLLLFGLLCQSVFFGLFLHLLFTCDRVDAVGLWLIFVFFHRFGLDSHECTIVAPQEVLAFLQLVVVVF